jgi:hypothetical protein
VVLSTISLISEVSLVSSTSRQSIFKRYPAVSSKHPASGIIKYLIILEFAQINYTPPRSRKQSRSIVRRICHFYRPFVTSIRKPGQPYGGASGSQDLDTKWYGLRGTSTWFLAVRRSTFQIMCPTSAQCISGYLKLTGAILGIVGSSSSWKHFLDRVPKTINFWLFTCIGNCQVYIEVICPRGIQSQDVYEPHLPRPPYRCHYDSSSTYGSCGCLKLYTKGAG